jgi:hypothetical protein
MLDPYEWRELTMNNPRRIQRHLLKALAAGSLLVAAALPMAIASVAGAATTYTAAFSTSGAANTGPGDSGTFTITASAATFAGDGGNATITAPAASGVTFSSVVDTDHAAKETITADYATAATATPGAYTLTVTDDSGTFTATNAITVDAAPTLTAINPASVADTTAHTPVVSAFTGTFVGTPTVVLTSTVNGTTIEATAAASGGTIATPATTDNVTITPQNATNSASATPGTYTITVINPDGGSYTSGPLFTVTGNEISEISPSAVPLTAATYPITVWGGGFASSATLTLSACGADTSLGTATVVSGTEITDSVIVAAGATALGTCVLTVTNAAPGNLDSFSTAAGALGLGEQSTVKPSITASSLSAAAAVSPGSPQQTITFTGNGFSQYTTPVDTTPGTSTTSDGAATIGTTAASCLGGSSGTTLTCELTVSSGAITGAHSANVDGDYFANSFSVAGPTITSAAPTALAVGAPVGTTIVLTGTGFAATSTGAVAQGTPASGLAGDFQYVNATTEDFVVTAPPTAATAAATPATLTLTVTDAYGATSSTAAFGIPVGAAPTVTSTTYATGTSGVGVGATAQTVTINGSGFVTGATVTGFVNGTGVADPDVTATDTGVNTAGTILTATIKIAAGDLNTVDGFTVTNTNGGVVKATAVAPAGLVIDAAPTITSVTPTTGSAGTTTSFAVAGTGFATGAVTTLSPANGTCGTTTVSASTTIAATCTLGQPGVTGTFLVVTNPDGGSATSTTAVLAAAAPPAPAFHVSGVHGAAVAGKWVTVSITGTGFYGQPKITSNAAGSKFAVTKDTGRALTVKIWTKAGLKGEHVLTVHLANGKSGKAGYNIKA